MFPFLVRLGLTRRTSRPRASPAASPRRVRFQSPLSPVRLGVA